MRPKLGELFFLSALEKGRTPNPFANPREIASFEELVPVVGLSLKASNSLRMDAKINLKQPFGDENLIKKLVLYRDQFPKSHRIIRTDKS